MTDMMTLLQVMNGVVGARLVANDVTAPSLMIRRVHTDTRTIEPGDLFVALRGERFDANEFLAEAKARGAVAALCQGDADGPLRDAGLPGLVVPDAKAALGQLALAWRAQFNLPLIAVTGSNGKTTVTQMIAAILSAFKPDAYLATQGNFNNDIGVPLTLLRLRAHHEIAVIELGMNHPGEIAALAAMAQPTVALVNNAQREHLEFMVTVEAVAHENGAVIEALAPTGYAVFPSDEAYTPVWSTQAGHRPVMSFGATPSAQVHALDFQWHAGAWKVTTSTPKGVLNYDLHIAGKHNVKNSMAATACALAAGVPVTAIERGLSHFEPVKGRSRAWVLTRGVDEVTLIDDTYNANPDSVAAAIEVLGALPGPRLLVLGDMGEVGNQGPQFHAEAGTLAQQRGIDMLFTLGELSVAATASFGLAARHFESMAALQAAVITELPHVTSVLVKGSRFMKMERVIATVTAELSQQKETTGMPLTSEPGHVTCC